jgi:DNA-binding MarR family transcriptional regulator
MKFYHHKNIHLADKNYCSIFVLVNKSINSNTISMNDFDNEILSLPYNLYRSAISIRSEITRRLTDEYKEEFTADYWHVLNTIINNEPLSSGHLAEITGRDRASISRTLGCMERLDLIRRVNNPSNKRSELILSTKFAFEFKVKAEEIIREVVSSSLKDLKPIELMELNRMLGTISSRIADIE